MAIPEIIKWEDIHGFSYKKSRSPVISKDINLVDWKNNCVQSVNDMDIDYLKRKKISLYDINYLFYKDWSVFQCLNAEIDYANNKYVLNDREWYLVNQNFVSEVDDSFESMESSDVVLPNFRAMREPEYNRHVHDENPDNFDLLDAKVVRISGGRSTIEFCDLFTKDKKIIHVKKYGGSSVLSHLFQQGVVSGELMLSSKVFRERVNEKLSEGFKFIDTDKRPDPKQYEICFAIMSSVHGDLHIPFFSKVVLKNAVTRLQAFGYKVTKMKINI